MLTFKIDRSKLLQIFFCKGLIYSILKLRGIGHVFLPPLYLHTLEHLPVEFLFLNIEMEKSTEITYKLSTFNVKSNNAKTPRWAFCFPCIASKLKSECKRTGSESSSNNSDFFSFHMLIIIQIINKRSRSQLNHAKNSKYKSDQKYLNTR